MEMTVFLVLFCQEEGWYNMVDFT